MQLITKPKTKSEVQEKIFSDRRSLYDSSSSASVFSLFLLNVFGHVLRRACVLPYLMHIPYPLTEPILPAAYRKLMFFFFIVQLLAHTETIFVYIRAYWNTTNGTEADTKRNMFVDAVCSMQPCVSDAIVIFVACAIPYTDYA